MLQVEFLTQIMCIAQHTSTEAQPATGAAKMPALKMQDEKSIACFKISLEETFLCLNALFKKKFRVLPVVFLKSFPGSTHKDVNVNSGKPPF